MGLRQDRIISLILVCLFLLISRGHAQDKIKDSHIEVSLRMIGHQVLLNSYDSTSRVLPIIKEKDGYRIQFESEFEFKPEELVSTVDRVIKETKTANRYIVEVEQCETGELVYSFKMDSLEKSDIIPCKGRIQPKACYSLLIILLEADNTNAISLSDSTESTFEPNTETSGLYYIIGLFLVFLVVVIYFIWKRRRKFTVDPNWIPLGEYYFDKRNMELVIEQQRIELTSKEADLLLLLYNAANTTVERDVILNMVWGDEGDYVGRTLDVFISKLRKKLEFDSKVKIVNIRGVGYKLVMDR